MHKFLPLVFLLIAGCASDEPPQEGIRWNDPYMDRMRLEAEAIDRYCRSASNAQFFSAYSQIPQIDIPPSEHLHEPHRHGLPNTNRRGMAKMGAFMSRNVAYDQCVRSFIGR